VRIIGGKRDRLVLSHRKLLTRDLNARFSIKNNDERVERCGMLAKTFTLVKREQRYRTALILQQHTADDRAILVLQQVNKLFDLGKSN